MSESGSAFRDVLRNPRPPPASARVRGCRARPLGGDGRARRLAFGAAGAAGVAILAVVRQLPAAVARAVHGNPRRPLRPRPGDGRALISAGPPRPRWRPSPRSRTRRWPSSSSLRASRPSSRPRFGPAEAALLPSLARTPAELTAANATSSTIESVIAFVGPAVGGVARRHRRCRRSRSRSAWRRFSGLPSMVSRRAARRPALTRPARTTRRRARANCRPRPPASGRSSAIGRLRVLVGLFCSPDARGRRPRRARRRARPRGAGHRRCGLRRAPRGARVGGARRGGRRGRPRRAAPPGVRPSASGWCSGAPRSRSSPPSTGKISSAVLLGIVGVANTVVDVAGMTLLQRAAAQTTCSPACSACSRASSTPRCCSARSSRPPSSRASGARRAPRHRASPARARRARPGRRCGASTATRASRGRQLELLRGVPFLALLPGRRSTSWRSKRSRVESPAGEDVVAQGERGDRFYVIEEGRAAVAVDGEAAAGTRGLATLRRDRAARDVPRTATVSRRHGPCALRPRARRLHRRGHRPRAERRSGRRSRLERLGQRPSSLGPDYGLLLRLRAAGARRGGATKSGS